MFENGVLKEIFGPSREKVTGDWRKFLNKKLHDLYSSRYIIRVIKSRKVRWAGLVTRTGERRDAYRVLVGNMGDRHHL